MAEQPIPQLNLNNLELNPEAVAYLAAFIRDSYITTLNLNITPVIKSQKFWEVLSYKLDKVNDTSKIATLLKKQNTTEVGENGLDNRLRQLVSFVLHSVFKINKVEDEVNQNLSEEESKELDRLLSKYTSLVFIDKLDDKDISRLEIALKNNHTLLSCNGVESEKIQVKLKQNRESLSYQLSFILFHLRTAQNVDDGARIALQKDIAEYLIPFVAHPDVNKEILKKKTNEMLGKFDDFNNSLKKQGSSNKENGEKHSYQQVTSQLNNQPNEINSSVDSAPQIESPDPDSATTASKVKPISILANNIIEQELEETPSIIFHQ